MAMGFPGGSTGKESACNTGDLGSIRGLGWFPARRRIRLLTPVFWPGEFHGLFSPWGLKWSDRTGCIRPWLNGFELNVSKTLYLTPFSLAFIDQNIYSSFSIFLLPLESINSVSTHLSVCVLSHFSCVHLFATPWTVAHQAFLSMGFSGQEYRSGFPFPSPGDLPDPGMEPNSPALAGRFFTTMSPGKSLGGWMHLKKLRCEGGEAHLKAEGAEFSLR